MIERKILLAQLTGFMDGKIPVDDLHAWVLKVALSPEYPQIAEQDPLVRETVQALLDLERKDLKFVPSRRILEYFRRCLDGKEEYLPPQKRGDLHHIIIDEPDKPASLYGKPSRNRTVVKKKVVYPTRDFTWLMRSLRKYTLMFAWGSFLLHLVGSIMPELLGIEVSESAIQLLKAALPHMLYALFIVMPIKVLAEGKVFLFSFVLAALGAMLYCGMSFLFVIKFSLPLVIGLLVLPFAAVPSTLMLFVLLYHHRLSVAARKAQEGQADARANGEQ